MCIYFLETNILPHFMIINGVNLELNFFSFNCLNISFFWFDLISLFNSISTFEGYLMPKPFLEKDSSNTI